MKPTSGHGSSVNKLLETGDGLKPAYGMSQLIWPTVPATAGLPDSVGIVLRVAAIFYEFRMHLQLFENTETPRNEVLKEVVSNWALFGSMLFIHLFGLMAWCSLEPAPCCSDCFIFPLSGLACADHGPGHNANRLLAMQTVLHQCTT